MEGALTLVADGEHHQVLLRHPRAPPEEGALTLAVEGALVAAAHPKDIAPVCGTCSELTVTMTMEVSVGVVVAASTKRTRSAGGIRT